MSSNPIAVAFANETGKQRDIPRFRESVYTVIKEAILCGKLLPGQPLVEEQLATSLDVSRTPVREALAILKHEKFISPRGGRGLYVRSLTLDEFVEMFVANEAVEPFLARCAARLATQGQLDAMAESLRRAARSVGGGNTAEVLRASRDFHRLVGVASGNEPLTEFVVGNEERTDMYLLNYGKVIDEQKMKASNQEHEAIFNALVQRDPEAAARLTIYHAQSLRERFSVLFNAQQSEEENGMVQKWGELD